MKISKLYEKLSALDEARAETLEALKEEKDSAVADRAGFAALIDGLVDRAITGTGDARSVARLDGAFKTAGLPFSPSAYVRAAEAQNAETEKAAAKLLEAYPEAKTIEDVIALERQRKREVEALEQQIGAFDSRRLSLERKLEPITQFNDEPRNKTKLNVASAESFRGPLSIWSWLSDGTYRRARAALAQVKDYKNVQEAIDTAEHDKANVVRELDALKGPAAALTAAVSTYKQQAKNDVSPADRVARLRKETKAALANDAFVDAFAKTLPKATGEDFLGAAVKQRGLDQIIDFLDGRISATKKERSGMSGTLSKLRRAKSNGAGSRVAKGVKMTEEDLDRAVAATRLQGRYVATNTRAARQDTVTYALPSPSTASSTPDNGFLWAVLYYQMFMVNSSHADAACTKDIVGLTPDNAAQFGLQAAAVEAMTPNLETTIADMAHAGIAADVLGGLGVNIDAASLADIGNSTSGVELPDLSSIASDVAAAANVDVSVPGIDTGSFNVDTGGGYSGGGDYGGGGGGFSGGDSFRIAAGPDGFGQTTRARPAQGAYGIMPRGPRF